MSYCERDQHPMPPETFIDPIDYAQRAMRELTRARLEKVDAEFWKMLRKRSAKAREPEADSV